MSCGKKDTRPDKESFAALGDEDEDEEEEEDLETGVPPRPLLNENPRSRSEDVEDEMEAVFDASDNEDDVNAESQPLNPLNTSSAGHDGDDGAHDINTNNYGPRPLGDPPVQLRPVHSRRQSTAAPCTYDFEADDYDFPPSGLVNSNSAFTSLFAIENSKSEHIKYFKACADCTRRTAQSR